MNKHLWVNIYEDGPGFQYYTKEECIKQVSYIRILLYRIHVRLK